MYLKDLEHIDLTNNSLINIPLKFFERNEILQTVILCHNIFKQFSQRIVRPYSCIDLSGNNVERFDDVSMQWFDRVDKSRSMNLFKLILQTNPMSCFCETLIFTKWMLNSSYVVHDNPLRCAWRGESVVITRNTIKEHKKECDIQEYLCMIIVGGTIALCVIIVISGLLIHFIKQLKNKRARAKCRQQAMCDIKHDQFRYKFVAFLLYHLDDGDVVLDHVNPHLNNTFSQITDVDRNFVCFGDIEFRPGYSIFNETHRCLTESAVIVAVVSQCFCTSIQSCNELEQAIAMQKTIFMLQTEVIPDDIIQPVVKELCKTCLVAKTEFDNDRLLCVPSMKHVCMSILEQI